MAPNSKRIAPAINTAIPAFSKRPLAAGLTATGVYACVKPEIRIQSIVHAQQFQWDGVHTTYPVGLEIRKVKYHRNVGLQATVFYVTMYVRLFQLKY